MWKQRYFLVSTCCFIVFVPDTKAGPSAATCSNIRYFVGAIRRVFQKAFIMMMFMLLLITAPVKNSKTPYIDGKNRRKVDVKMSKKDVYFLPWWMKDVRACLMEKSRTKDYCRHFYAKTVSKERRMFQSCPQNSMQKP